jgi:hypothetical protein
MEEGRKEVGKYEGIMPEGLAKVFYESKIFKDVQSEAQAIVKILAGREMGLSPIQSMNTVYILDSKIGYETKVFLSKLKKSGKYDYEVTFVCLKDKNNSEVVEKATLDFFRIDGKEGKKEFIGSSQFTMYDAARIGLINKAAYKNYPKLMMFYRAASNGIKMYCPEILEGGVLAEDYIEVGAMSEMGKEEEVEVRLKGSEINISNKEIEETNERKGN